jgi:hypothetical protein
VRIIEKLIIISQQKDGGSNIAADAAAFPYLKIMQAMVPYDQLTRFGRNHEVDLLLFGRECVRHCHIVTISGPHCGLTLD